jgi:hypothetical protein
MSYVLDCKHEYTKGIKVGMKNYWPIALLPTTISKLRKSSLIINL